MIEFRPARATDADAAAAVLRASIRRLCTPDHGDDPERIAGWCANKTPDNLRRWAADPSLRLLLAVECDRILGVALAALSGDVLLNYVAPGARFRGISAALLTRLETELQAAGCVESTRTAHVFYRARGWRDAGPPTECFGLPGYPMLKRLPRPAASK
jgi:GNAT superfamily N-acetyltransferase